MPHIIVVIENLLVWWVIIGLFLALNIYLGSPAVGWIKRWLQKRRKDTPPPPPEEDITP